jgi:hypothetical protein
LSAPATNTDRTLTLPDNSGTVLTTETPGVPVNGPAFSAYAGSATSLSSSVETKVLFDTEEYDTNSNFASSRFTPTVAGYYQINAAVRLAAANTNTVYVQINKNGTSNKIGTLIALSASYSPILSVSSIIYLDGSTDYVEIYAFQNSGSAQNTSTSSTVTWFNGALIRSAT